MGVKAGRTGGPTGTTPRVGGGNRGRVSRGRRGFGPGDPWTRPLSQGKKALAENAKPKGQCRRWRGAGANAPTGLSHSGPGGWGRRRCRWWKKKNGYGSFFSDFLVARLNRRTGGGAGGFGGRNGGAAAFGTCATSFTLYETHSPRTTWLRPSDPQVVAPPLVAGRVTETAKSFRSNRSCRLMSRNDSNRRRRILPTPLRSKTKAAAAKKWRPYRYHRRRCHRRSRRWCRPRNPNGPGSSSKNPPAGANANSYYP